MGLNPGYLLKYFLLYFNGLQKNFIPNMHTRETWHSLPVLLPNAFISVKINGHHGWGSEPLTFFFVKRLQRRNLRYIKRWLNGYLFFTLIGMMQGTFHPLSFLDQILSAEFLIAKSIQSICCSCWNPLKNFAWKYVAQTENCQNWKLLKVIYSEKAT